MLEETIPRYSPPGRLYVPYRTLLRVLSDRQTAGITVVFRVPNCEKYETAGLDNFLPNSRRPETAVLCDAFARCRWQELIMPKNPQAVRPASAPTEVDGALLDN